ncbi:MAG TPA: TIGR01777 family oxidoreductase [Candidatus Limnocylindrales bacterium]|nr:TIGR01777 family oxidoreductase [Candidatus Limnocylindrales bacterium]
MKILISGASGLVGTALTRALRAEGHTVAQIVRAGAAPAEGDVRWDPDTGDVDLAAMEAAHAVVCLNGASIAGGRWTKARKQVLSDSRIHPVRLLVESFEKLKQKPRVFLCASAIGFYGNRGDEILTEASASGNDFLSEVCRQWEAEAMQAQGRGIRTACLRFGVILSIRGGALQRMLTPFKMGLGGRLGDGRQWMSWVALDDAVGSIRFMIENESFSGPVNIVSPRPVQNAEFTRVLASILHRPAIFPAPAFALRLALGELADALLLASQRVEPERLAAAGYPFRLNHVEPALRAAIVNQM